jgi:NhaP-type Na+/H+ or K+/H+ antiporter
MPGCCWHAVPCSFTPTITHTPKQQELSVIALLSYASYLLADICGLSAILSLFVCGVVVSHYALHNVSTEGRMVTLSSCKTAAHIAEGVTFIYVVRAPMLHQWGAAPAAGPV